MLRADKLPSLLGGAKTPDQWAQRRNEIKDILQREEYGYFPPILPATVTVNSKKDKQFGGFSIVEELTFSLENRDKQFSFPAKMIYPNDQKENIPFFVFINFGAEVPHKFFYPDIVVERGVGILTFCYHDVSIDKNEFGNGLESLFIDGERNSDTCFGKITLWAYAMQRALDYLLTRPEVDSTKIFTAGHSRLGKTALLAAAFDERFAGAHSNCSGNSGAAISRDNHGETIKDICNRFPHWFCKNYTKYSDNEDALPFDQHFLLGLIAPRKISVAAALEDTWADSYNQYLSCVAVNDAYKLLGKNGFITDDEKQILEKEYLDGDVYYRERIGNHFFTYKDWLFATKSLLGK